MRLLSEWNEARIARLPYLIQLEQCTRWIPPGHGFIKINSDGAVLQHERKAGVGQVARDSLAVCVGALAVHVAGIVNPLVMEMVGLLEGMKWARDRL